MLEARYEPHVKHSKMPMVFTYVLGPVITILVASNGFFLSRIIDKVDKSELKIYELSQNVAVIKQNLDDREDRCRNIRKEALHDFNVSEARGVSTRASQGIFFDPIRLPLPLPGM